MAETYQTEEEQLETLKKWWDENSRSTFLSIALVLGGFFGWQGWQDYTQEQAEAASGLYDSMLQAAAPPGGGQPSPQQVATARHLAGELKTGFSGTAYAQFAALHLARLAVMEEDLASAEEELRWVLAQSPDTAVQLVATLRLARVLAAGGDYEGALATLQVPDTGAYDASFAEAEGDIQLALGNPAAASLAYERALMQGGQQGQSLALKLDALNPVPPRDVATQAAESDADTGAPEGATAGSAEG